MRWRARRPRIHTMIRRLLLPAACFYYSLHASLAFFAIQSGIPRHSLAPVCPYMQIIRLDGYALPADFDLVRRHAAAPQSPTCSLLISLSSSSRLRLRSTTSLSFRSCWARTRKVAIWSRCSWRTAMSCALGPLARSAGERAVEAVEAVDELRLCRPAESNRGRD